jgi:AraC-like DNA-binding protein
MASMLPFSYREKSPNKHLRSYINCYWRYRRTFREGKTYDLKPSNNYELIWIEQGSLFTEGQELPRLFVSKRNRETLTVSGKGKVEVWSVQLKPWGLVPFFNRHELTSKGPHPAGQVFGEQIASELTDIFKSSTKKTLASNLDEYFLDRMLHARFEGNILKLAGRHILAAKGSLKVKDIADFCNVSRHKLEHFINKATGARPRDIASRIKFEQLRNRLALSPDTPLDLLAQELGYSGQSHLSEEFAHFTGTTPLEYAKAFHETYDHIRAAAIEVGAPDSYVGPSAQDRLFS